MPIRNKRYHSTGFSNVRDGPLFFYWGGGGPILVSQHTIFLAIQQLQTIFFSLLLFVRTIFLIKKFMNFAQKILFMLLLIPALGIDQSDSS